MKLSLPDVMRSWYVEAHDFEEAVWAIITEIIREVRRFGDKNVSLDVNCKTSYVEVTSPGVANTEFTVTHGLGVIPFMHISNGDANGVIYDSRRVDWTASEIYLKCTGTNVAIRCLVLGR